MPGAVVTNASPAEEPRMPTDRRRKPRRASGLALSSALALMLLCAGEARAQTVGANTWRNRAVPTYMEITGAGMAAYWIIFMASGGLKDRFFQAKDGPSLLWPHISAELGTATALMVGGVGLYRNDAWGKPAAMLALGALAYTSLNSMSASLAREDLKPLTIPFVISLAGSAASIAILW